MKMMSKSCAVYSSLSSRIRRHVADLRVLGPCTAKLKALSDVIYCIISNIGAASIEASPGITVFFSRSNCKRPWALELILGGA